MQPVKACNLWLTFCNINATGLMQGLVAPKKRGIMHGCLDILLPFFTKPGWPN